LPAPLPSSAKWALENPLLVNNFAMGKARFQVRKFFDLAHFANNTRIKMIKITPSRLLLVSQKKNMKRRFIKMVGQALHNSQC
jgi:hypothetical protein